MIQNTNDIYKLIKSPSYALQYDLGVNRHFSYNLYNTIAPYERISVIYVDDEYMDIYKFNNMNSEYYERISRKSKSAEKIRKILLIKRIDAMLKFMQETRKVSDRLPQR